MILVNVFAGRMVRFLSIRCGGIVFLLFCRLLYSPLVAQDTILSDNKADKEYRNLDSIFNMENGVLLFSYLSRNDSLVFRISFREKVNSNYRKKGIELWNRFPNDERKYKWFKQTMRLNRTGNYYWKNIEQGARIFFENGLGASQYSTSIDWKELMEWEKLYPSMLKEYRSYCELSNRMSDFIEVLNMGLSSFLRLSLNREYRQNRKMSLHKLRSYFLPPAERLLDFRLTERPDLLYPNILLQDIMDTEFISKYNEYGLNSQDMELFFYSLQKAPSKGIKEWAKKRNNIFLLMGERGAFQFKHRTIDGVEIDFQRMRGKVVLMDFWATWCKGCIDRMPVVKKIYDRYKDRNFVVLSACLNGEESIKEIENIKNMIGADWPTLAIGKISQKNSLGSQIWSKYNFFGVPQLLLFNKRGNLVLINDVLRTGDFEPIVRRLVSE